MRTSRDASAIGRMESGTFDGAMAESNSFFVRCVVNPQLVEVLLAGWGNRFAGPPGQDGEMKY